MTRQLRNKFQLGHMLLACDLVAQPDVDAAIAEQKRSGSRLGAILMGQGSIGAYRLHQALAEQQGLPFVDLSKELCDLTLLDANDRANYLRYQVMPWRKRSGGTVLLATTEVTPELQVWAAHRFPKHAFVITSPLDISRMVQRFFADEDDGDAREMLWRHDADKSAKALFASAGARLGLLAACASLIALLFRPGFFTSFFIAMNLFYATTLFCKLVFFTTGWRLAQVAKPIRKFTLKEHELPVYTLLIPMYKEKRETIENLVKAIRALDYPKAKLDVKFIVEADDTATIEQVKAVKAESWFEIIRVPYSLPRTKPKACNYALKFARGEYVTIYDAEDRPEPKQLKKVLQTFRDSPENTACVQARLNYYNYDENILTRMFALEYASWFDFMLPGLYQLDIPIPLGGTSNHFPTEILRKFYAWDPYNVTEDADLGIRIAHYGYRSGVVDSLTLEEAPVRIGGWLRQRSRWIKGYIQTFIVHMRNPIELYKILGKRGFFGFLFFVGAPAMAFLTLPFVLGASFVSLFYDFGLPEWFAKFALLNFAAGIVAHIAIAMVICKERKWRKMKPFILIFPFYWALHSFASFRAFWQLLTRPHYWEKTEHGLSKMPAAGNTAGST